MKSKSCNKHGIKFKYAALECPLCLLEAGKDKAITDEDCYLFILDRPPRVADDYAHSQYDRVVRLIVDREKLMTLIATCLELSAAQQEAFALVTEARGRWVKRCRELAEELHRALEDFKKIEGFRHTSSTSGYVARRARWRISKFFADMGWRS